MDSGDLVCLRCERATLRIGDDRSDRVFDFKNKIISQTIFAFFIPVRGSEIFLKCFFVKEEFHATRPFRLASLTILKAASPGMAMASPEARSAARLSISSSWAVRISLSGEMLPINLSANLMRSSSHRDMAVSKICSVMVVMAWKLARGQESSSWHSALPPRLEPIQHGHPNGDAVFHLVVDEAALVVHHGVAEFDAAVHGAGVHEVEAALADFL